MEREGERWVGRRTDRQREGQITLEREGDKGKEKEGEREKEIEGEESGGGMWEEGIEGEYWE